MGIDITDLDRMFGFIRISIQEDASLGIMASYHVNSDQGVEEDRF